MRLHSFSAFMWCGYLAPLISIPLSQAREEPGQKGQGRQLGVIYTIFYSLFSNRNGPLVRQWCMRFEAKHYYFKRLAKQLCNFKNLPKSLNHWRWDISAFSATGLVMMGHILKLLQKLGQVNFNSSLYNTPFIYLFCLMLDDVYLRI